MNSFKNYFFSITVIVFIAGILALFSASLSRADTLGQVGKKVRLMNRVNQAFREEGEIGKQCRLRRERQAEKDQQTAARIEAYQNPNKLEGIIPEMPDSLVQLTVGYLHAPIACQVASAPNVSPEQKEFTAFLQASLPQFLLFADGHTSPPTFSMGRVIDYRPRNRDYMEDYEIRDNPQFQATLSPFAMATVPVTRAFYKLVSGSNPAHVSTLSPAEQDAWEFCPNCPVTYVSPRDADAFVALLREMTNEAYDLPTEAEQEYVRRGKNADGSISTREYDFDGTREDLLRYAQDDAQHIHPVAQKLPNSAGVYDTQGNITEISKIFYGFYPQGATINPQGPTQGPLRVTRGAAFAGPHSGLREAFSAVKRQTTGIDSVQWRTGFRLVKRPS
jgi:formylglycine-generating enzyme required for sulfatase activity